MYSHIVEVVFLLIFLFFIYHILHTPISTFLLRANFHPIIIIQFVVIFQYPWIFMVFFTLVLVPQTLCASLCIKDIFKMTPCLLSLIFTFIFHLKFTCFFEVPKTKTQTQKHRSMLGQFLKDHFFHLRMTLLTQRALPLAHSVEERKEEKCFYNDDGMTSFNVLIHTMLDKEKWKKERREKKSYYPLVMTFFSILLHTQHKK